MGLYLRKSFRMGPLRLNVSRSGLGASFGVKGARIGMDARGRAYVHAGRGGLYYREYLGGRERPRPGDASASALAASSAADLDGGSTVIYEDTGAAYPPTVAPPPRPVPLSVPEPRPDPRLVLGLFTGLGGVVALFFFDTAGVVVGAALLIAAALFSVTGWRADRARARLRGALARALATGPTAVEPWAEAEALIRRGEVRPEPRRLEIERAFLAACRSAVADGRVSSDECDLLDRLDSDLGGPSERTIAARVDAFLAVYVKAVADRALDAEEESTLGQIRRALRVREMAVRPYIAWLHELHALREIQEGTPPAVEPTVPLPAGEVCYLEAPGRLLGEKQLRTFQRDHVRYHVRGLVLEHEGTLLITSRRVLLVHDGTTSIPLAHILHVEIDADANVLRITRDDRATPLILSTPDVVRAGALLGKVTQGEREGV